MDRNSIGHARLMAYYRILDAQNKLLEHHKNGETEFCSLCFEPKCEHNVSPDSYEAAIGQLRYWAEIALAEARPVLVHSEHPVATWDSFIKPRSKGNFYFYPYLPIKVVQIKRHVTLTLPEGETLGRISAKPGYYYYHNGVLVCRFYEGKFYPNTDILDTALPGAGKWYAIPKASSYEEFMGVGVQIWS